MKNIAVGIVFMLFYQCTSEDRFKTIKCIDDSSINLDPLARIGYIGCAEATVGNNRIELLPLLLYNEDDDTYTFYGYDCENGRLSFLIVINFKPQDKGNKIFSAKEIVEAVIVERKGGDYLSEKQYSKNQKCSIKYKVSKQNIVDMNMDLTFMNKEDSSIIELKNIVVHTRITSKEEVKKMYTREYHDFNI